MRNILKATMISAGLALTSCGSEPEPEEHITGAYRDAHGCIPSAGYEWSETAQECVRPWEQEQEPVEDDTLQEFGRVLSVEDGAYPMFSVTMEFPERQFQQSFSLNVEAANVDPVALMAMVDQYATIVYTSELGPSLMELQFGEQFLFGGDAESLDAEWTVLEGTLGGATSLSGDLPSDFYIDDADGNRIQFKEFITEETLTANGNPVTAYYATYAENIILKIKVSEE